MKNLVSIVIAARVDDLSVAEAVAEIAVYIKEQTHDILEREHSALIQDKTWEQRQAGMGRMANVLNRHLDQVADLLATDLDPNVKVPPSYRANFGLPQRLDETQKPPLMKGGR